MAHIFISYKHEDLDFITVLTRKLEDQGFTVWTDGKLTAGDDWRQGIDNAIKSSFCLITVMTPEARVSEYVTYEWAFALGFGVRVIPVILKSTELHPRLSSLQYENFTTHSNRPWEKLLSVVNDIHRQYSQALSPSLIGASPEVSQAISDFSNPISEKRINALLTIGHEKHIPSISYIVKLLNEDKDYRVRSAAAEALGDIGSGIALTDLFKIIATETIFLVRKTAITSLGKIADPVAVPLLITILNKYDEVDIVRLEAAKSLTIIGDYEACKAIFQSFLNNTYSTSDEIFIPFFEFMCSRLDENVARVVYCIYSFESSINDANRYRYDSIIGIKNNISIDSFKMAQLWFLEQGTNRYG